jgi:MerR family transcriptional regulator, redox-sensitive transcriptional activator SoxR
MRAPAKSPPPNAPPLALSVGEVARRSGVPVSTVHFYQAKGLIAGWRSSGNQRRFPRGVLRRIAFIRVAQRAGVPLSQIRSALSTLPAGRAPSQEDWRRLSSQWRGEVEERIRRLTQLRDRFDDCIGCGCLSLKVCPLRNPDDRLAREGTGPRLLERKRARQGAGHDS